MHNIEIKQKVGSIGPMTGRNTEILLDGKPLKGVLSAHFTIAADGIAVLKLDVIGNFNIEANLDSDRLELQEILEQQSEELYESEES
jgi:hypothetical protein